MDEGNAGAAIFRSLHSKILAVRESFELDSMTNSRSLKVSFKNRIYTVCTTAFDCHNFHTDFIPSWPSLSSWRSRPSGCHLTIALRVNQQAR